MAYGKGERAQKEADKDRTELLERRIAALEALVAKLQKEDARLAEVICRVDKEVVSLELDVRGTDRSL